MAAPMDSGLAALYKQKYKDERRELKMDEFKDILTETSKDLVPTRKDMQFGYGMVTDNPLERLKVSVNLHFTPNEGDNVSYVKTYKFPHALAPYTINDIVYPTDTLEAVKAKGWNPAENRYNWYKLKDALSSGY